MAPNESEDEHMEGDDGTEDSSLAYDPNQNREEKSKLRQSYRRLHEDGTQRKIQARYSQNLMLFLRCIERPERRCGGVIRGSA